MTLFINTSNVEKVEFQLLEGKKVIAEYSASLKFHEGHKILSHLEKFLLQHGIISLLKITRLPDGQGGGRGNLKKGEPTPYTLNAISLYSGPGSYTGLRIGTAIAQSLSLAWNIPLKMTKNAKSK